MTIMKKAAVILAMAFAFSANSVVAVAEEAATESTASAKPATADVISNLELGLPKYKKATFPLRK